MDHDLVLSEGLDPVLTPADIALDQLHTDRQRWRAIVGRRRQVIEDSDLMPLLEEQLPGALTYEAGAAGDQHLHFCGL